MELDWAAVIGGMALVWIGSERTLRALLRSRVWQANFDASTACPRRAWALGVGLASLAPGSERLGELPDALVRTGRLSSARAAAMAAGSSWATLVAFLAVAVVVPLDRSACVLVALGLAGLGFALSRVGRVARLGDVVIGCACTLGGAAAILNGFVELALTPVELAWSWTAQLGASFVAGCIAMLALRSEGVLVAMLTGAAVAGALDPYSTFSAVLGAHATGAGLGARRAAPRGARWWYRRTFVAACATTILGWFATGWMVLFGGRLPETLQRPAWLLGSLLALVVVAQTAISMIHASRGGPRLAEPQGDPRPSDVGLAPMLTWDGALASTRRASSIVRRLAAARLKGAVVDAARIRRSASEVERLARQVGRIGESARAAEVPGWFSSALQSLEASCLHQREVIEATSRLTVELSDELGMGSFASRVRQAKLFVLNYLESCDDFIQARTFELPTTERDAVRVRLAATKDVITGVAPAMARVAERVVADVHYLETMLDLELAACQAVATVVQPAQLGRSSEEEVLDADEEAEPTVEAALPRPVREVRQVR